ncbi:hypothetical protein JCM11641_000030 [Rhodosporidiobolus odoratus]
MASPRRVAVALILLPPPSSTSTSSTSLTTTRTTQQATLSEPTFLLVSSRKKQNLYVLPKGGIEVGESPRQAAEREAWEEAGLELGSATHLTHLLTSHDPSPHILSPTTDTTSASFVPSCEYSFELFLLPPPAASCPTSSSPSSVSSSNPSTSPSASTATSSAASTSPSSSPDASALSSSSRPSPHPSLLPHWPESSERHRRLVHSWANLEKQACWGRREGVMREAIGVAREWVDRWESRGRVVEEEEAEEEEEGEGEDGRLGSHQYESVS